MRNSSGKLQCDLCPSSFKRPEHLKRHYRIHEPKKRFACEICLKEFSRSDVLSRHEVTHSAKDASLSMDSNQAINTRRGRACHECARARIACSKEDSCTRCVKKNLKCVYPASRRKMQLHRADSQGSVVKRDILPAPWKMSPPLSDSQSALPNFNNFGYDSNDDLGALDMVSGSESYSWSLDSIGNLSPAVDYDDMSTPQGNLSLDGFDDGPDYVTPRSWYPELALGIDCHNSPSFGMYGVPQDHAYHSDSMPSPEPGILTHCGFQGLCHTSTPSDGIPSDLQSLGGPMHPQAFTSYPAANFEVGGRSQSGSYHFQKSESYPTSSPVDPKDLSGILQDAMRISIVSGVRRY